MLARPEVSFDGFIKWLETKDPAARYDWWNVRECLAAQYVSHIMAVSGSGLHWVSFPYESFFPGDDKDARMLNYHRICCGYSQGWTFGAALQRARSLHDKVHNRVPHQVAYWYAAERSL